MPAESQPLLSSHHSKKQQRCTRWCPFSYSFQFIHSKGAILVLFWSVLFSMCTEFATYICVILLTQFISITPIIVYTLVGITFLYPLIGLIGDIWISRYKLMIVYTICFISILLFLPSGFIAWHYQALVAVVVIGYISKVALSVIGLGFQITLITFNIDQLIGSSSDELSAVIHWHIAGKFLSLILVWALSQYMILYAAYVCLLISCICLTAILVSHSFLKHWLDTTPDCTTMNPLKLIARVLQYTRKHKYPENRSALTYWEQDAPSRLDLGKEKYGGPFTEEEVEDVKTVFKLTPLFICNIVLGLAATDLELNFSVTTEVYSTDTIISLLPLVCILLYQFMIYPCCHQYIPSLLKQITFGIFLCLLASGFVMCLLFIHNFPNYNCYNIIVNSSINVSPATQKYRWFPLIPHTLFLISLYLIRVLSMEFTIAQSPKAMRGLMVGLLMFFKAFFPGLIDIVFSLISKYFLFSSPKCGFYISVARTGLILVLFISFVYLASKYKYRVRSNEINVHIIAEDHIQRYIDQSDEYRHNNQFSDDSLIILSLD